MTYYFGITMLVLALAAIVCIGTYVFNGSTAPAKQKSSPQTGTTMKIGPFRNTGPWTFGCSCSWGDRDASPPTKFQDDPGCRLCHPVSEFEFEGYDLPMSFSVVDTTPPSNRIWTR